MKETAIKKAQKHTMSTLTSCPICTKALKKDNQVIILEPHYSFHFKTFYYLSSATREGSIANTGNQTPPNHQIHQNSCAKCYQVTIFTMYSNYEKL